MTSRLRGGVSRIASGSDEAVANSRVLQVVAWTWLFGGLALFLLAVVFIPKGVSALVAGIQEPRTSLAEVIDGTVLYQPPAAATWQQLPNRTDIPEGTRLRTDDRSRVFLTLVDGSTVLIYPNTELAVQRMSIGRFNPATQETVLRLFSGRVAVAVSRHPYTEGRELQLLAEDATLDLPEGSYRVAFEPTGDVDVSVRQGAATVWYGSRALLIGSGQRAVVAEGVGIQGPLPDDRALLAETSFATDSGRSKWWTFAVTEAGAPGRIVQGADHLRFVRETSDRSTDRHGEVGIAQTIERDIRDYSRLHLVVQFRLDRQTLSGGGFAGTEYPLLLRVIYVDALGREQIWAKGFYFQNEEQLPASLGDLVGQSTWITYDNPNLLQEILPTPVVLQRIEILGSGWEFDAGVRRVELSGR